MDPKDTLEIPLKHPRFNLPPIHLINNKLYATTRIWLHKCK